jgi:hypothetical protein
MLLWMAVCAGRGPGAMGAVGRPHDWDWLSCMITCRLLQQYQIPSWIC